MRNIRLEKVKETVAKASADPKAARVPLALSGSWRVDEDQPQFGGAVVLPNGKEFTFESDFPPFLGGEARRPSPLHYCFWGGMACFASTLALTAAQEGVELGAFRMRTTGTIDFNGALGLGGQDPISDLTWEVIFEQPPAGVDVDRLVRLAEERCPASWMLKNAVPFTVRTMTA